MSAPERVVVLGAGQAAAAFAAKLRAEGFAGAITVVGEEPDLPYQRPPLSKKYLLGELPRERLYLRPESFWAENEVEMRLGETAEAIDRDAGVVRLASGEALPFDALLIATGARPRRLPAEIGGDLPGVHVLRTLADIDALQPEATEGRRALVIGGGYIGLEAAAVLSGLGLSVTLVEAAPRILGRVAAERTADWFRALHGDHGVRILEGAGLARLEAGDDGRLARAVMADGTSIPADLALVGIGVTPNAELAEAAGLETAPTGVVVDAACRTSDPRILAAGDVADLPWRGRRVRLESVQNAIDQAEAAALTVLGREAAYDPVPWFWSDQYDAKLQIAGLNLGFDRVVERPGARAGGLSVWYFAGPELIAVDAMNDPRAYMTGKRWLEAGRSPDADALADPEADLKTL